jgi:hypothetical protein
MARGWESKSVEAQQEERAERKRLGLALSPHDLATHERRSTLELSRARAVSDLTRASSPAHRKMLEGAIAALEQELAALDDLGDAGNRGG